MPAGPPTSSGGSYASLESQGAGENVYRPTTMPGGPATGLLEGVKKALGFGTLLDKVGAAASPSVITSR